MRIGVISDTHKENYYIQKAINKILKVDIMIHLGDNVEDVKEIRKLYKGNIVNVKGNCDLSGETPSEKLIICDEKRILLTHGHKFGVKDSIFKLRYKALETEADIVLYGHTHVSKIDFEDGIFFVNPGSTTYPRNGLNSVAIIDINEKGIVPYILHI